jgi:hypothetical protein
VDSRKAGKRWDISEFLLAGQCLGAFLGFSLFKVSFGICGPTSVFAPAVFFPCAGSFSTVCNLMFLTDRRRLGLPYPERQRVSALGGIAMIPFILLLL